MNDIQKSKIIIKRLIKQYGEEIPLYLNYNKKKQYEFLFAVILSAQTTDKNVNEVTSILYKKYTKLSDFNNVNIKQLEQDIYSTGFYHSKAKNIKKCANMLINVYNSKVPDTFNDLIKLPGVGRKTANVVLSTLFNKQALAVDTHVKRISNRLFGFDETNVDKLCDKLERIVNNKYWHLWNTHIIALGRTICSSHNPKCNICFLNDICCHYLQFK